MTREYPPEVQKLIAKLIALSQGHEDYKQVSDAAFDDNG
jgi:hypothetical protein